MTRSNATLLRLLPLLGAFFGLAVLSLIALATLESFSWADMLGAYGTLGEESALSAGALEEVVWHAAGARVDHRRHSAARDGPARRPGAPARRGRAHGRHRFSQRPGPTCHCSWCRSPHSPPVTSSTSRSATSSLRRRLCSWGLLLWVERGAPRPAVLLGGSAHCSWRRSWSLRPTASRDRRAFRTRSPRPLLDQAWVTPPRRAGCGRRSSSPGSQPWRLQRSTPRRMAPAVVALVGVVLVVQAVVATHEVERASGAEFRKAIGSDSRSWIDDADAEDVTLLATDDRPWTADARTFFWNRSISRRRHARRSDSPRAPQRRHRHASRARRSRARRERVCPSNASEVVAPTTVVLERYEARRGTSRGQREPSGLVLWRVGGPIRVAQRRSGFLPNGDITQGAFVIVPACRPGRSSSPCSARAAPRSSCWRTGSRYERSSRPRDRCSRRRFRHRPTSTAPTSVCSSCERSDLVGTTRVEFVPDA